MQQIRITSNLTEFINDLSLMFLIHVFFADRRAAPNPKP
jgi:hypothetical protein